MRIARFKAECKQCSNIFLVPLLSDFSYGEFIGNSRSGRAFVYLNAFEEKAWDVIKEIVNGLSSNKMIADKKRAEQFQRIVGKCMDKIDGEEFSMTEGFVCPKCLSNKIDYDHNDAVDFCEIKNASFDCFLNMKEQERINFVENLMLECNE